MPLYRIKFKLRIISQDETCNCRDWCERNGLSAKIARADRLPRARGSPRHERARAIGCEAGARGFQDSSEVLQTSGKYFKLSVFCRLGPVQWDVVLSLLNGDSCAICFSFRRK